MKKLFFSLAIALFCISCSNDGGGNPASSSSGGGNGGSAAENGRAMISGENGEAEKPYAGSSKIYLADIRNNNNGQPILTDSTMVEAGTIGNGEIVIVLPANIDSRFLRKINSAPAGMNVEPLGVEVWFYTDPLRLLSNGKHIGDLEYMKKTNEGIYHKISYFYFSKNTELKGSIGEGGGIEYKIEAKKGWNKVYLKMNTKDESAYITTNLSDVPDELTWLVWEVES